MNSLLLSTKHQPIQFSQKLKNYECTTMEEMKLSGQKHKINVNIYEYFGMEQSSSHNGVVTGLYDISEQWFFDKSYKPFNALHQRCRKINWFISLL